MSRIQRRFDLARKEKRPCFVAYMCAGDPDYDTSLEVCRLLLNEGVDILELGVPFSDPLADGKTNQLAAQRALESGMTQEKVFRLSKALREEYPEVPIVYYTYYNLVYSHGIEAYVGEAKAAGVDGMLVLDLPPEEADELLLASQEKELETVFIVAPTTPPERVKLICDKTTGFVYYVSREGVTGERDSLPESIPQAVGEIRKRTNLPVVVGFGISTPEHVRKVGEVADGVVVGSALVNCISGGLGDQDEILRRMGERISELLKGLRPSE